MKSVNTRKASRRSCKYSNIDQLEADLQVVQDADGAGRLSTSGNWSVGMNLEHIAKTFEFSLDGFPAKPVAPIRWAFVLFMRKRLLAGAPFPAGIRPPPKFLIKGDINAPLPSPDTTLDEGLTRLRAVLARLKSGERFVIPNPIFGKMSHEQALTMQLRHAELHMGFIQL